MPAKGIFLVHSCSVESWMSTELSFPDSDFTVHMYLGRFGAPIEFTGSLVALSY